MNSIKIWCDGSRWMARFLGPHAAEIMAAVGTDTIPTPFTGAAPAARVVAELAARNPGATISVYPSGLRRERT